MGGEPDNNPKPSAWQSVKNFFKSLFGGGKKSSGNLEVGPAERITEKETLKIDSWSLAFALLLGNADPYSAIGNAGVGPYAEERETVGMAAMIFINPEAAVEGLERKALSRAAMSKIWGAGPRIDPQNLPKSVTSDFTEILAGRGTPIIRGGVHETVRNNTKWVGGLEWKIKDVPGTGLNGSRLIQHPTGKWGLVIDHDYTKIIQIPTSSAVKWK